uniref:Uncharacterized protein n=1 Tax=Amphimedon queenslandica TaxID=400682 RepID=A0A1X7V5X0_AMPQE
MATLCKSHCRKIEAQVFELFCLVEHYLRSLVLLPLRPLDGLALEDCCTKVELNGGQGGGRPPGKGNAGGGGPPTKSIAGGGGPPAISGIAGSGRPPPANGSAGGGGWPPGGGGGGPSSPARSTGGGEGTALCSS